MKKLLIPVLAIASLTVNAEQTFYLDFGAINGVGELTVQDASGNYWNNIDNSRNTGNAYIYPGTVFNLINSRNEPTVCSVLINTRFALNNAGGLSNPSPDLLGDLAVASATGDFARVEDFQDYNYITFRGLDPGKGYVFHAYGCRAEDLIRRANYSFRGLNEWNSDIHIGGIGSGTNGYNGNDHSIVVSDPVFPDENGEITFTINRIYGMMHINAMKIEEKDNLVRPAEPALSQEIFIDFGGNEATNSRGHRTLGADLNGNFWNNFCSDGEIDIPAGSILPLINSNNEASGITATTDVLMRTNGLAGAGGLTNPDASNLGELAIASATEDFIYLETNQPSVNIRLTGADPDKIYRLKVFGSRLTNETDQRWAVFHFSGATSWAARQDFSGRCIGGRDANNQDVQANIRNISVSDYIHPDPEGTLIFTIEHTATMAHVNAMKIEEYYPAEESVSATQTMYIDFGDINPDRGHATTSDNYGHMWNNLQASDIPYFYPGVTVGLVNAQNNPTGYEVLVNTRFMTGGRGNIGLTAPTYGLLKDLAVPTATEDYAMAEVFQDYNHITFRNLDPDKAYVFHTFGTYADAAAHTAEFIFQGLNNSITTHTMGGNSTGIDNNGYNGNNSSISVSQPVFPDENGEITFTMKRIEGTSHISAMKIVEFTGYSRPALNDVLNIVYIDFGTEDMATDTDMHGNSWNNIYGNISSGVQFSLINHSGEPTLLTATVEGNFTTGSENGIAAPVEETLRDLAISSATGDYAAIDSPVKIIFSGAKEGRTYRVKAFGGCITSETGDRWGTYSFQGDTIWSTRQDFSGRCIGGRDNEGRDVHGNRRNLAVSMPMSPAQDGTLTFSIIPGTGISHINALKLEEYASDNEDDTTTGIHSVAETITDGPVEVYNLQGIYIAGSVDALPAGFYIVHQGTRTYKIAIR